MYCGDDMTLAIDQPTDRQVETLLFMQSEAASLGLPIDQIRELMALGLKMDAALGASGSYWTLRQVVARRWESGYNGGRKESKNG